MATINFEGMQSHVLSVDTYVTSYDRVMFSVHGGRKKEIFDNANLHAAHYHIHNISCAGIDNRRADWEQIFGPADPEHPFLDSDQETPDADDQEGRTDQTLDAEVLRQQEKG